MSGGGGGGAKADKNALPPHIYFAARDGDVPLVMGYLDGGGLLEAREEQLQYTLLFGACLGAHESLIDTLLEKGASVNALDSQGCTPLMRTAFFGHLSVVEKLLQAGARTDLKDKSGRTAMTWAGMANPHVPAVAAALSSAQQSGEPIAEQQPLPSRRSLVNVSKEPPGA